MHAPVSCGDIYRRMLDGWQHLILPHIVWFMYSIYVSITQYGSTVYIGMAMGGSGNFNFRFQFQFNLSSKDIKVDRETAQSPFLHVKMRREKSLGDLYKHVSDMLNINLALRGGGDWACDIWHMT